jgi:hypothetical protein
MTNSTSVFIGVKADNWNDTKNGDSASDSGFFDNFAIQYKRQSATVGFLYLGMSRNVAIFGAYHTHNIDYSMVVSGFIEIVNNKVQMGVDNDYSTYYEPLGTYPGTKGPTSNANSSGIKRIGVYFEANFGGSIDFASVDFDNSQPIVTPYNHAFESTSTTEQITMSGNVFPVGPIYDHSSQVHPKNTTNYTSVSGSPWSLSCVFKVVSGDTILYSLESTGTSNFYGLKIELKELNNQLSLYIKMGGDFNSTYNLYEVNYANAFSIGFYQCIQIQYLGHNTIDTGNNSFTDADYEDALQVSKVNLTNTAMTRLTGGVHTSTTPGVISLFNPSITPYTETICHIANINGNANFASFSLVSLRNNQPIMNVFEKRTILFHAFDWLKLHRENRLYRSLGVEKTFAYGDSDSLANNIIYVFGDHPNYTFPYDVNASRGIGATFSSNNGQFSNAQITNSTANSIININIPNLS